jgi:hypothetical protein
VARTGRSHPARPIIVRALVGGTDGAGTITGIGTLTGSGVKNATGTATISGAAVLAGTGGKHGVGSGTVTGVVALSGSGTKQSGIGLLPRPRLRWQLVAGPASGGHELGLSEARSRRFVFKLNDPHEVGFTLDGRHPQADYLEELQTDVHVLWTSDAGQTQILTRCRVGNTGDDIGDAQHATTYTALDYRAVLAARRLYDSSQLTWTGIDQAEIAWGLVEQTQTLVGGNLGISKRWMGTTPTGVLRDRTYEVRDSIGERIQELSEVIDGFDWEITPASASALTLDVWSPQRGVDRGVVLEYGGLVSQVRREVNVADYGNAIQLTGDDNATPAVTPEVRDVADLATRTEGRWDRVYGDTGLTTQAALAQRADWQLSVAQVIQPVYTLTLRQGGWEGPDHIWLGDPVRLVVRSGRLRVDTSLRVHEIAVSPSGDGDDTVQVTVGGPRPDFRRRPADFDRRLRNLERR